MAKHVRIKLNQQGIRKLLQSKEVQSDLRNRTSRIRAAAGSGFEARVDVVGGSSKLGRAMGYVSTKDAWGRQRQARNQVLQRSLHAGK